MDNYIHTYIHTYIPRKKSLLSKKWRGSRINQNHDDKVCRQTKERNDRAREQRGTCGTKATNVVRGLEEFINVVRD